MLFLESPSRNPHFNLALEEYVFTRLGKTQDVFMLWQNERTIVVGVHQNTAQEINAAYVKEHDIRVVRRLTGGGAVYHDSGNLNYTIITEQEEGGVLNFALFARPVIDALATFGIEATCSGRNDVLIDEKKISGCAQMVKNGRVLHHGCILLDSNLTSVTEALRVREDKYKSKGIASVRSRVTTINAEAPSPVSMADFRRALTGQIRAGRDDFTAYTLTDEDLAAVTELQRTKYETWDWNYGKSPDYDVEKERRFSGGLVTARMQVHEGKIRGIRFTGDFFGEADPRELEEKLCGTPLADDITGVLSSLQVERYFHGITAEEIAVLLLN